MIIPFIKENINKEIYKIFPDIITINNCNKFQLDMIQIVHFRIYNLQLKNIQYVIGYYGDSTYLIKSYINSSRAVYIFPLINNHYLNLINNRGLKISYITKHEQWHDDDELLQFYINDTDINYYLQKLYYKMNLNITYDQFKEYLQQIIIQVKANELLFNI